MGDKLFIVTVLTLFMFLGIDWFTNWYNKFLTNSITTLKYRTTLLKLVWAISALIFWIALLKKAMPESFTISYFLFALFIFSLFGLLKSVFRK